MSEEQLKAFLEKVTTDTNLQEMLKEAADTDAVTAIAREAGFAITTEDIQSLKSDRELSHEELESVAGGGRLAGFGNLRPLDLLRGTFTVRETLNTRDCTCGY